MLFTKSVDYAILALNHMAQNRNLPRCRAVDIANTEKAPIAYMAKTLQMLALAGLVKSVRGRKGGFSLSEMSWSVTIGQLIIILHEKVEFPAWVGERLTQEIRKKLKEKAIRKGEGTT